MASAGAKGKAEALDRPLFLGPSPSFDMRDATVVMAIESEIPPGVSASGNGACDDQKSRVPSAPVTRRPLFYENIRKRPHPSIPHSMTTSPAPCALMPRKAKGNPYAR